MFLLLVQWHPADLTALYQTSALLLRLFGKNMPHTFHSQNYQALVVSRDYQAPVKNKDKLKVTQNISLFFLIKWLFKDDDKSLAPKFVNYKVKQMVGIDLSGISLFSNVLTEHIVEGSFKDDV